MTCWSCLIKLYNKYFQNNINNGYGCKLTSLNVSFWHAMESYWKHDFPLHDLSIVIMTTLELFFTSHNVLEFSLFPQYGQPQEEKLYVVVQNGWFTSYPFHNYKCSFKNDVVCSSPFDSWSRVWGNNAR